MTDLRRTPLRRLLLLSALMGGASLVEDTATGNPVTFETDVAKPLASLEIPFTPQQEGTGDPSPQNDRPIVPWNGLFVYHSGADTSEYTETHIVFPAMGKNLFNATIEQGTISAMSGSDSSSDTRVRTKEYIRLVAGNYTISATGAGQCIIDVYGTDEAFKKDESSTGFGNLPRSFTVVGDRLVRFAFRKSSSNEEITPADISNVMLNTGSSAQPYEPYTNSVYGGTLDVASGVLTVEYGAVALDSLNWEWQEQGGGRFYATSMAGIISTPSSNNQKSTAICSCYKTESVTGLADKSFAVATSGNMFLKDTDYSDKQTLIASLSGQSLVYPLATPQEIQLTPSQITALVGGNTIWSDADGQMTAVYLKKA